MEVSLAIKRYQLLNQKFTYSCKKLLKVSNELLDLKPRLQWAKDNKISRTPILKRKMSRLEVINKYLHDYTINLAEEINKTEVNMSKRLLAGQLSDTEDVTPPKKNDIRSLKRKYELLNKKFHHCCNQLLRVTNKMQELQPRLKAAKQGKSRQAVVIKETLVELEELSKYLHDYAMKLTEKIHQTEIMISQWLRTVQH